MIQAADGDTEAEQIRSWAKTIGIEPTDWQVRAAAAIMRGEQVSWPKAAGRRTVARILEAGNTEETNS
jgi:superfamily II RNA helicase